MNAAATAQMRLISYADQPADLDESIEPDLPTKSNQTGRHSLRNKFRSVG